MKTQDHLPPSPMDAGTLPSTLEGDSAHSVHLGLPVLGAAASETLQGAGVPSAYENQPLRAGWVSVKDELPPDDVLVWTYRDPREGDWGPEDRFDSDMRSEGVWVHHNDCYEDFMAVGGYSMGGPDCSVTGPSADAPYTHWMAMFPPDSASHYVDKTSNERAADRLEAAKPLASNEPQGSARHVE